jgi:RNA polymerase sigma factor (sigma-70 family)
MKCVPLVIAESTPGSVGRTGRAVSAAPIPAFVPGVRPRSRRLLALARDDTLVEQMRRGNEAAFDVCFERYATGILNFCSHMLGSREEAEDAVQHTFASAFRDVARGGDRAIALKPWLYAIARNRCLSLRRARRARPGETAEPVTMSLDEHVEHRLELRQLLRDVHELPEDQRAALLLTQAGELSGIEVAAVLDCDVTKVKALVFRARTALINRRDARETPCDAIREKLANLRGGSLRRAELRDHLRDCPGCRAYRKHVQYQRRQLAIALPVAPSVGLKSTVLAGLGLGGGTTVGGLTAGVGGLGTGALVKLAAAGALTAGGVAAGATIVGQAERPVARAEAHAPGARTRVAAPAAATTRSVSTSTTRSATARVRRDRGAVDQPASRDPARQSDERATSGPPAEANPGPVREKKNPKPVPAAEVAAPRPSPAHGRNKPAADEKHNPHGGGRPERPATHSPARRGPLPPKPAPAKREAPSAAPRPANTGPPPPKEKPAKPAEPGAPSAVPPSPHTDPPPAHSPGKHDKAKS